MQQHQVLNRFESIAPLPVRAQNLFDQVLVFQRQTQLLRAGDKKIQLIRRIRLCPPAGQNQSAHRRLAPWHRDPHQLMKIFALKHRQHGNQF